jgi:glycosyltransferase involved in cell wall biosynthesis
MKVLHLGYSNVYSGGENVICQIISIFKSRNDKIEMIFCVTDGPIVEQLKELKIPYITLKKFNYLNIKQAIDKIKPDIIHAHDMKATFFASLFYGKYKIISHIHCNHQTLDQVSIKSVLLLYAFRKCDHIFWVSESAYNDYRFRDHVKNKSTILSNVIDAEFTEKRANEHENDFIEGYDLILLGRLTYQKNPQRFVQLVELIKTKYPNIRAAIVGSGELENEIRKLIDDKALSSNIELLGYLNNPLGLLKKVKLLVMTSRFEGTPMVALEAMTLGVPVVCTPVDGLKEIIINDVNGYMSDDNEVLANEIIKYLTNKELYDIISSEAHKRIINRMNIENYYHTILERYI